MDNEKNPKVEAITKERKSKIIIIKEQGTIRKASKYLIIAETIATSCTLE